MLRIFKEAEPWYDSNMFFDLNGTDYTIVDQDTDVHVTGIEIHFSEKIKSKIRLALWTFHNFEDQISNFLCQNVNCICITNAVDRSIADDRIIFSDFLFNRTKAYYLRKGYRSDTALWYHAGEDSYVLPKLDFNAARKKIFLAVNNTYRKHLHIRPQINYLLLNHPTDGYVGDASIEKLYLRGEGSTGPKFGYHPVSNDYYKNTYVSIYGETIEFGKSLAVTEKTYEPLIKGHFILPFSTNGFIDHLRSMGFRFPSFINYEYDAIEDYKNRSERYVEEMVRLINIPINQWQEYYHDSRDIISHNRQLFIDRPFHQIDLEKLLLTA